MDYGILSVDTNPNALVLQSVGANLDTPGYQRGDRVKLGRRRSRIAVYETYHGCSLNVCWC